MKVDFTVNVIIGFYFVRYTDKPFKYFKAIDDSNPENVIEYLKTNRRNSYYIKNEIL